MFTADDLRVILSGMKTQLTSISLFVLGLLIPSPPTMHAGETVQFSRDVLPILSDRCFHCHGPDEEQRQADLRLDERESTFEDRGGYAAVVAGDAAGSEILRRILSDDESEVMPPPDSHRKPLSDDEIAVVRRWINDGAQWGSHWAFESPVRPDVSEPKRNAIDFFVERKLKEEGLNFSPEADRRTLIRRLTLDLTGLPPTPEQVQAFINDDSADAYEQLVERTLQSPHYGERMAWLWLDAARYADTSGYQGDPERTMWPWRDWVVNALNENMPFDQFTIEQLAGDLLPNATPEQRLATGFHRNHMHNGEGGRIAEETRIENVFDRTETTGTVWMGLTLECCRCHDHKFDPTSNLDYFAFFDFFNQTTEQGRGSGGPAIPPAMDYVPAEDRARLAKSQAHINALRKELLADSDEADASLAAWVKRWAIPTEEKWDVIDAESFTSINGATITRRDDLALHVTGDLPEKDIYEITATTNASQITALRLDALLDPDSLASGTGRDENGNFVLSEFELRVRPVPSERNAGDRNWQQVRFSRAESDAAQGDLKVAKAIDGIVDDGSGWAVNGHVTKEPRWANFYTAAPIGFPDGTELSIRLRFESPHTHHSLALFRLSLTETEQLPTVDAAVADILVKKTGDRSPQDQTQLREHFRLHHSPIFKAVAAKLTEAREQHRALENKTPPIKVMVMDTVPKPRDTFVLVKGVYNNATDQKVTADVPGMLPPLSSESASTEETTDQVTEEITADRPTRLDLARWIVSPENPLTSRVTVNRYWQMFFGRGIVATPGDFGLQGAQPSHPELLDWLAVEFMESGWDVKHMQRLIVTSDTYKQSSRVTPELLERDPENLLLARSSRRRMPSWMLRDQALAVSGLLNEKLGGPPVKPYQPDGIWAEATFGKKRYQQDEGNSLYRRSLYTFWRRIVGPTMFFDESKRQTCDVQPSLTNTPLHALTTMNEIAYVEAARALAEQELLKHDSIEARIDHAFLLLTARPPEPSEMRLLSLRLAEYIEHFTENPDAALQLLSIGDSDRDETLGPAEHAAYTTLFNTLLNLDEALVKP